DLEPVVSLDGLADTDIEQYKEVKQINQEGSQFIEDYVVYNGKGDNVSQRFRPEDEIDSLFGESF
ncbi:hypothetical protein Q6285_30860, partial [Klebsiella pneumoniae]|nr:hypothetical protein [Klebsiella pneumoniae]